MNCSRFSRISSISVRSATAARRRRRRCCGPRRHAGRDLAQHPDQDGRARAGSRGGPRSRPARLQQRDRLLHERGGRPLGGEALGQEARHPPRERAGIGDRLALDDPGLVEQQPGQLVELRCRRPRPSPCAAMRRVSSCWPLISSTRLESLSSWLCCLRKRSSRRSMPWSSATRQTALSLQPLGGADVGDVLAQRGLEPGDQPLELGVAQRLLGRRRLGLALDRRTGRPRRGSASAAAWLW